MINSDNKDYWATLCEGPQLVLYENLRNQRVLRPSQVCSTRGDCTRRGKNIANTNIFSRSSVLLVLRELMIRTGSSLGTNKVFSA